MIDLSFNNVSKRYRLKTEAGNNSSGNLVVDKFRNLLHRHTDFWALRDVSFEVSRGEALGIIGHNGAGKSTILKLLANITAPSSGEIIINGRLSALIEVGSGFHPELTGRENIYLNGSILGMSRREIRAKLDRIVDFAGVEQFIDTPVKRFSSGMYVRLGFSIAAHLDPDILLLDEVLAVGDASFQTKCLGQIDELKSRGTTIVFISHDLAAVERICDRVILLEKGMITGEGPGHSIVDRYLAQTSVYAPKRRLNIDGWAAGNARVIGLSFLDLHGNQIRSCKTLDSITVRVEYESIEPIQSPIEVFFFNDGGTMVCQLTTSMGGNDIDLPRGSGSVDFVCNNVCLQPGVYSIDISIIENDWQHQCATLRVDPGPTVTNGAFYMPFTVSYSHELPLPNRGLTTN
jgi:ABC-type polysaccharide/polyol phosphate transport system ATPase subunit